MSSFTNRCTSACFEIRLQSNQLVSLSWQYALLLPRWVRRTSSPIRIIGMPSENIVQVKKFLTCLFLRFSTAPSSVGPSTPQFQLQLSLEPSRLPSPFASLCFTLKETR